MSNKKDGRIRKLADRVLRALKKVPKIDEVETGIEIEIPKPVVRFFIKVKLLHDTINKVKSGEEDESREKSHSGLHNNDESPGKRGTT